MLSSLRVSWRNVTRHKKRFFFTLIAIVLGVAVMTSMFIAKDTFSNLMEEQERLYAGEADFWIQSNEGLFHEKDLEWIKNQEEIEAGILSLLKQGFVEMETDSISQASVRLTGISDYENDIVELPVKEGDVKKQGLIITENASKLWGKGIGDIVTFQNMGSLEITSIVYEGPMLNSPKTMEEALYRDFRVMVPLPILQEWTGLEQQVSNYRFRVKEGADHEQLLENYQSKLEGTPLFAQPVVVDSQQNNDVEGIYYVFDVMAILAIFISGFIAFNMVHTSIVERKKEFGIMKSLGYTTGKVVRLIVQEISILAVMGTVIGLGIGVWLGIFVQEMLITAIATQNVTYDIVLLKPMITSTIVGLLFPFVAAVLPLYKAGKTPILEAMFERSTPASVNRISKIRIGLGVIFTAIGLIDNVWAFLLLFVGLVLLFPLWMKAMQVLLRPMLTFLFRFSGKQAIHSLKQFEKRNANTAAMLAIGVSLALFMSAALQALPKGMEDEIRATYGGDIHLQRETQWTDSDIEKIKQMNGVEQVHPLLEVPNVTWYTKDDRKLREFSIMSFSQEGPMLFVVAKEATSSSQHPPIYIAERALTEWGGEVGDEIILHTPVGEQTFFIKGSVLTSHYSNYVAFAEKSIIQEMINWPWSYQLMVEVGEEEIISAILDEIWQEFGESISGAHTIATTIENTTSGV